MYGSKTQYWSGCNQYSTTIALRVSETKSCNDSIYVVRFLVLFHIFYLINSQLWKQCRNLKMLSLL